MCQKNLEWCRKWCSYRACGEAGDVSGGADGYFVDWGGYICTFLFYSVPGVFRCGLFLCEVFRNVVDADAELVAVDSISIDHPLPQCIVIGIVIVLRDI